MEPYSKVKVLEIAILVLNRMKVDLSKRPFSFSFLQIPVFAKAYVDILDYITEQVMLEKIDAEAEIEKDIISQLTKEKTEKQYCLYEEL